MIGLTPCFLALDQNSNAPNTLPWSVIAMASMPSSAVRANMSSSRAAPSSMEYSVCTWRWANPDPEPAAMGGVHLLSRMTTSQDERVLTLAVLWGRPLRLRDDRGRSHRHSWPRRRRADRDRSGSRADASG